MEVHLFPMSLMKMPFVPFCDRFVMPSNMLGICDLALFISRKLGVFICFFEVSIYTTCNNYSNFLWCSIVCYSSKLKVVYDKESL